MEIEGTHDFIAISIGKFDGCLVSLPLDPQLKPSKRDQ